jgi:acyl transferase domain-containing protein
LNTPRYPTADLTSLSGEIPHAGGSFLKDTTKFDNLEFGVANKDAKSLTASSRRLIELSFLALLDSGINYRGKSVGSFMAGTNVEYWDHVCRVKGLLRTRWLTAMTRTMSAIEDLEVHQTHWLTESLIRLT